MQKQELRKGEWSYETMLIKEPFGRLQKDNQDQICLMNILLCSPEKVSNLH